MIRGSSSPEMTSPQGCSRSRHLLLTWVGVPTAQLKFQGRDGLGRAFLLTDRAARAQATRHWEETKSSCLSGFVSPSGSC